MVNGLGGLRFGRMDFLPPPPLRISCRSCGLVGDYHGDLGGVGGMTGVWGVCRACREICSCRTLGKLGVFGGVTRLGGVFGLVMQYGVFGGGRGGMVLTAAYVYHSPHPLFPASSHAGRTPAEMYTNIAPSFLSCIFDPSIENISSVKSEIEKGQSFALCACFHFSLSKGARCR